MSLSYGRWRTRFMNHCCRISRIWGDVPVLRTVAQPDCTLIIQCIVPILGLLPRGVACRGPGQTSLTSGTGALPRLCTQGLGGTCSPTDCIAAIAAVSAHPGPGWVFSPCRLSRGEELGGRPYPTEGGALDS